MWRPPMTRQPGPRRKSGALSRKATRKLVARFQERPATSNNAIPGEFVLKVLKMALAIFIHRAFATFYEKARSAPTLPMSADIDLMTYHVPHNSTHSRRLQSFFRRDGRSIQAIVRLSGRRPILRGCGNMTSPKVRFQLGPCRVRGEFVVISRDLSDHKENRECECRKSVSEHAGQAGRKRIELGSTKSFELVTAREAST
jgi:hypothetical protein